MTWQPREREGREEKERRVRRYRKSKGRLSNDYEEALATRSGKGIVYGFLFPRDRTCRCPWRSLDGLRRADAELKERSELKPGKCEGRARSFQKRRVPKPNIWRCPWRRLW